MSKIFIVKVHNINNSLIYKRTFSNINLTKTALDTLAKAQNDKCTFKIQSDIIDSLSECKQSNIEITGYIENNIVHYNDNTKDEKKIILSNKEIMWEISKSCCYALEGCCEAVGCILITCKLLGDCCEMFSVFNRR